MKDSLIRDCFSGHEQVKSRLARRISEQPDNSRQKLYARPRRGFTLIELLVVIAIIGILTTLLLATLSRTKAAAKSAACKSNLRQLGIGLSLYLGDFGKYPMDYFPRPAELGSPWQNALRPYISGNQTIFTCPGKLQPAWLVEFPQDPLPYQYNRYGTCVGVPTDSPQSVLGLGVFGQTNVPVSESRVVIPSDMIAVAERWQFGWFHHPRAQQFNDLFCDGHVEANNPNSIPNMRNTYGNVLAKPSAAHPERWNNDNQPHPETWPAWPNP